MSSTEYSSLHDPFLVLQLDRIMSTLTKHNKWLQVINKYVEWMTLWHFNDNKILTFEDEDLVLIGAVVGWLLVSDAVVVVCVVPDDGVCASVTGKDSGTVCNVVLIVADILS